MLSEVKEGFYAQLKVVFDKLTGMENRLCKSPQEMDQSKSPVKPQEVPRLPNSQSGKTTENKMSTGVLKVSGGHISRDSNKVAE